jgi:hypothetical protein
VPLCTCISGFDPGLECAAREIFDIVKEFVHSRGIYGCLQRPYVDRSDVKVMNQIRCEYPALGF